ncbi:hypothetical protein [Agromyces arachidis]|uniref:hypothetical protein n=1 Tax=Agromyces arachidis TaxID=766966 RepID=UPI0040575EFE
MTEQQDPRPAPADQTAPTAPAPSASPDRTTARRPWYRQLWVPVAAALVLMVLAFGSGFVAGQAASLLGVDTVAAASGADDDGPRDGGPDRDGRPGGPMRGLPGPHADRPGGDHGDAHSDED